MIGPVTKANTEVVERFMLDDTRVVLSNAIVYLLMQC